LGPIVEITDVEGVDVEIADVVVRVEEKRS